MVSASESAVNSSSTPPLSPEDLQAQREVVQALLDLEFDPKGAEFTAKQIQPTKAKQVASVLRVAGQEILAMIERELTKTPGRNNPKGILSHRLRKSPWKVLKEGGDLAQAKAKRQEEAAQKRADLERGASRAGADLSGVPDDLVGLLSAWCQAHRALKSASVVNRSYAWDMLIEAKGEFINAALKCPQFKDIPSEIEAALELEGLQVGSMARRRAANHRVAQAILNRLGVAAILEA